LICLPPSGRKTRQARQACGLQCQHRAVPLALPVGQNVGKRHGAARAAFGLF
jgi:hypothetical protein